MSDEPTRKMPRVNPRDFYEQMETGYVTPPKQDDNHDSGGKVIGSILSLLLLSALLPAYAHVLWEIVQWSWNLIG